jgi:hypothetical protein
MSEFAFLAAPAQRALANAGITGFAELARWREADLLALHGMGPSALRRLAAEMAARGIGFADG